MKVTLLLVLGLLGLQMFLLANLQFTAWPEMLSYAYLRNNDFLLYKDMIHPYPPILTMVLSVIYKVFGYHLWVLQWTAWIIILTGSFLVFVIIKILTRRDDITILGLALYVLLQPFMEGNMLWFDIAIIPPILLGVIFLLKYLEEEENKWLILAGLSLGVAALVKQTTAVFLILTAIFLFVRHRSLGEVWKLAVGPTVLLILLVVKLIQEDALVDFTNWTTVYPLTEWGRYFGYVEISITAEKMLILFLLFLPVLAGLGINIVRRKFLMDGSLALLFLFLFSSLLIVYPRFSFFHFQLALAFLIVTTAYVFRECETKKLTVGLILFLLILLPFIHKPVIAQGWQKAARFYSQGDTDLAEKIADLTDVRTRVFLLGPHSGLYIIANRLPPKRWTDNFGWYLEIPGVQEEIIARWEENPPNVVLWSVPQPGNWFDLGTYQPKKIASWIESNYTREKEITPGIWLWKLVPRRNDEG